MGPPWFQAVVLSLIMVAAVIVAWRSFGTSLSILGATTPGHVFLVFFVASTAFGSIVLLIDGDGSSGGAALAAFGLVAFAVGAAVTARVLGVPEPLGPPSQVGRYSRPAVILLAAIGLAAVEQARGQSAPLQCAVPPACL